MPPLVSIVGKSGSGKTVFLEKLIRELSSRGYRLATIKHTHHAINFDQPQKDSWRHARAGAAITMCTSSSEIQIVKPVGPEVTIEKLAAFFGEEYDLVITEGFSGEGSTPKIEVHRKEAHLPLLNPTHLMAFVTDEPLETEVRQFGLEDAKGVSDMLEETFLKPSRERLYLYINGEPVPLSDLSVRFISQALLALAGNVKDATGIERLEFRYRKGNPEL
jgi:molybdopterin-guanine dinucleotide biosynthesis adapter protein